MTLHSKTPYPIPAVAAVLIHDDKVLLVCRGQEPNKGRWGFPGGKIEVGETIEEAALRELEEETGVRANAGKKLTAFDVIVRDEKQQTLFHYVLIPVRCHWLKGEPIAASDAAAAAWFPISDLDESDPDLIDRILSICREAQHQLPN